jgi:hypothetical protein
MSTFTSHEPNLLGGIVGAGWTSSAAFLWGTGIRGFSQGAVAVSTLCSLAALVLTLAIFVKIVVYWEPGSVDSEDRARLDTLWGVVMGVLLWLSVPLFAVGTYAFTERRVVFGIACGAGAYAAVYIANIICRFRWRGRESSRQQRFRGIPGA